MHPSATPLRRPVRRAQPLRHGLAAFLLAALLLAPHPSVHAQDRPHLALITELDGAVAVTRADGTAPVRASWGLQLFDGDRVETRAGARTSILFANNNLVVLGPNASMTVSGGDAPAAGTAEPVRNVSGPLLADVSDLTLHRTGRGEVAALGGLRSGSGEPIELVAPLRTKVATPTPHFAWHAADGFETFRVRVFDADGLVWEGETADRSLVYPSDAPPLDAAKEYLWQVEGEEMLDSVTSPLVPFAVLAADARAEVAAQEAALRQQLADDGDDSTLHFALGSYYVRTGLLDDAIGAFERIAERHPDAPLPFEILGTLYSQTGRKDAAIRAFQQAVALKQP